MFGLSQKSLATVTRNLGTLLANGVPIAKSFRLAARKASGAKLRNAYEDISSDIKTGSTVAEAVENTGVFPALYCDLIDTAEQAGALPEVLHALADHYDRMVDLKRDFRAQIAMPVLQFVAAIFVIALLIFVLGLVAKATGGKQIFDPTGLGLSGSSGALTWLGGWAIVVTTGFVGYQLIRRSVLASRVFDRVFLNIPVVGNCLQKFALARFAWAYHLTQNAGLSIDESIRASMRATSNGAFISAGKPVIDDLYDGAQLSEALQNTELFPVEFLEMVAVGETSGTVPEALDRLSPQLEADARRSLKALAATAGWLVWVTVAAFIIYIVFRIFLTYVGVLNDLSNGI